MVFTAHLHNTTHTLHRILEIHCSASCIIPKKYAYQEVALDGLADPGHLLDRLRDGVVTDHVVLLCCVESKQRN